MEIKDLDLTSLIHAVEFGFELTQEVFCYLFSFLILNDFKREIDVELFCQLMANLMFFQCRSKPKLKRYMLILRLEDHLKNH